MGVLSSSAKCSHVSVRMFVKNTHPSGRMVSKKRGRFNATRFLKANPLDLTGMFLCLSVITNSNRKNPPCIFWPFSEFPCES